MAQPSKQQAASVLDSVAGWRPLLSTPQTKSPALGGARKGGSVMKQKASLTQIAAKPRRSQQHSPAPMFQIGAVPTGNRFACRAKRLFVTAITAWNKRLNDIEPVGGTSHESDCSFNPCIRYHCRQRNSHCAEHPCAARCRRRSVRWV